MKLIRLRLLNFRQHASSTIEFRAGLTGIIGPNGAGKSTILESIAWALYGAPAARGTNDTIRFSRAPGRSRVEVELTFELGGHEYRVLRTMNSAVVHVDGGATPVVNGVGAATEYMQSRLHMSREEFFNTYFTGQKELQFLAQLGPAHRARFLNKVLGYERLRIAQDRVRTRRNELKHEIEGIRAALPDPAELAAITRDAQRRRTEAAARVEIADADRKKADARAEKLKPKWDAICLARDDAAKLDNEIKVVSVEHTSAQLEQQRAAEELARIARAEKDLAPMREQLAELPGVEEQCRRLSQLAALAGKRRVLEDNAKQLRAEIAEKEQRLAAVREAPRLAEQFRAEIAETDSQHTALAERASRLKDDWSQRKQEIETKLITYREHAQELKEQLADLREAGPDGVCPTCERPLGAEFEKVVGALQDEWDKLVQDGKWLRLRGEQLSEKPAELANVESERDAAARLLDDRKQKLVRCEAAIDELGTITADLEALRTRLAEVDAQLAEIPAEYDAKLHKKADLRLAELRELERAAAGLEKLVEGRARRETDRARADERFAEVEARLRDLMSRRKQLKFREDEYQKLHRQVEELRDASRRLELTLTEHRGSLKSAEQHLESALRAQSEYRERSARLDALELEHRHHSELDQAFTHLRGELNARVRPELSELASTFLTEITDARYTALEIDDSYNVLVLDEGEEKPVISGGEEDVANLVLRLAISQMIAERAGQPLSILILDEVFGSLDVDRRENVVQLLQRLQDRFDQVVLITHIDGIREGLDNLIRVEFDERTGASVVREETPVSRNEELVGS